MVSRQDIQEFIHLSTESLTQEDISRFPTIGDVKERLGIILGRDIYTHELAYPQFLIAELLGDEVGSSFMKATKALSEQMPVIFIKENEDEIRDNQ